MDAISGFTKVAIRDPSQANEIVGAWAQEFAARLASGNDVLPIVFACNDLAQESKKNDEERFVRAFETVLYEYLCMALDKRPELRKSFARIMEIWIARRVFSLSLLRELRAGMGLTELPDVVVVADEDDDDEDQQQPSKQQQAASGVSAADVRAQRVRQVEQLNLTKLLGLWAWIASRFSKAPLTLTALHQMETGEVARVMALPEDQVDLADLSRTRELVVTTTRELRELDLACDLHTIVHDALVRAIERDLERNEQAVERASEELDQATTVLDAVRTLQELGLDHEGVISAMNKTVRLVAKQRTVKMLDVTDRAPISLSKRSKPEAAPDGPQIWHKGEQRYVPLPSAGAEEDWR
jgi:hypothetical protein